MGNFSTPQKHHIKQCRTPRRKLSFTATYSQKKVKTDEHSDAQHNDMDVMSVVLHRGHKTKDEKFEGTWTYYHQFSGNFKQEFSGYQCNFDGESICSRSQLVGAPLGIGVMGKNNEWCQNPFDLNPYQFTTGGVTFPAVTVAPAPDFVHLAGGHMELNVLSMETCDMEVDIEWFICKKNTDNSPIQSWSYALQNKALGQGVATDATTATGGLGRGFANVSTGGKDYGAATVTDPINGTYGIYPSAEKEFRTFWKSMKKVKFILQPGSTKRINVKIDYHKTFGRAALQSMPEKYIAGYTIMPIYIVRAAPVYDPTYKVVTPGPVRIGYASQTKYRFMAPSAKTSRLEVNRSDQQFVYDGTLANLKVISDLDTIITVATQ